jgi:hypothetical protein
MKNDDIQGDTKEVGRVQIVRKICSKAQGTYPTFFGMRLDCNNDFFLLDKQINRKR